MSRRTVGALLCGAALLAIPQRADAEPLSRRWRLGVDVTWTPGKVDPFGVGVAFDVQLSPFVDGQPSPVFGGSTRVDVVGLGPPSFGIEALGGYGLHTYVDRAFAPIVMGDVRAGLVVRIDRPPALSLATDVEGGWRRLPVRLRGQAALAFPEGGARLEDPALGLGVAIHRMTWNDCMGCVDGRPLRDGDAIARPVVLGEAPADPRARRWLEAARDEHAAVAAFARLVAELSDVGAPEALVRRARRAIAEERDHAALCLQRASDCAGRPLGLAPMTTRARRFGSRPEALRILGRESWEDGYVNEGRAADRAAADAARADDPRDIAVHTRIAREERAHARLGADIAAWCRA